MDSEPGTDDIPPGLEDRVVRALRDDGAIGSGATRRHRLRVFASAAALVMAVGLGWIAGARGPSGDVSEGGDAELYALMIYAGAERTGRSSDPAEAVKRGREFGDWARERRVSAGGDVRVVEGVRLAGTAAVVGAESPPTGVQPSGFFLVRSNDEASLLRDAGSHPHVRGGGVLVVRRVGATVSGLR